MRSLARVRAIDLGVVALNDVVDVNSLLCQVMIKHGLIVQLTTRTGKETQQLQHITVRCDSQGSQQQTKVHAELTLRPAREIGNVRRELAEIPEHVSEKVTCHAVWYGHTRGKKMGNVLTRHAGEFCRLLPERDLKVCN